MIVDKTVGEALHKRPSGVGIECLPYGEFIDSYDRPRTLFYLDPPYYRCENYYGKGLFARTDFEHLADQLVGITSTFIMSLNDTPEVRSIFAAFDIQTAETVYTAAGKSNKRVSELIISNR